MNHPGSVHTKFYSCDWLIQSIIYSLARASDISRGRGPAKIPRNRPIYPRICPWKSREILLFLREISEALISEGYKGEGDLIWGGGGGGLGKRGFTVFTFDVHFMNVFSLCHICLRQRSTFTYCSILWETNLKAMVIIMWWVSIIHIPGWCLIDRETVQCKKQTPDSRLSSWQAIISVQKETIFSTLVHLKSLVHNYTKGEKYLFYPN